MGALIHSDKHLVLNNRYALLGCVAVSAAGKVYRGRDLEQVKQQGLESRVLIHVLPKTTAAWPLAAMFQQMHDATQRLRAPWILDAVAYGEDDELAYFVLESPASWELHSLLSQPEIPQHCLRTTRQQIAPLVKQGYLDAQIDPALLLCADKKTVCLLATAFAPHIQALEKRITHHALTPRKHLGQALMTGTLLTLFAVFTAVAGNAVMELEKTPVPMVIPVAQNAASTATLRLASLPSTAVTTLPVTHLDQPIMVAPAAVEAPRVVKPVIKPAVVAEKKSQPISPPVEKVQPLVQPPVAPVIEAQPVLVEHGSVDTLIQQAYAALEAGNLGGNGGALSFTRQLREQAAGNPHVARLGQEITAAHLRQVRVGLQKNEMAAVAATLPITRQLIQEFNLDNLTPAQQVLEDKVVALTQ